jgi:hypothetical protein
MTTIYLGYVAVVILIPDLTDGDRCANYYSCKFYQLSSLAFFKVRGGCGLTKRATVTSTKKNSPPRPIHSPTIEFTRELFLQNESPGEWMSIFKLCLLSKIDFLYKYYVGGQYISIEGHFRFGCPFESSVEDSLDRKKNQGRACDITWAFRVSVPTCETCCIFLEKLKYTQSILF